MLPDVCNGMVGVNRTTSAPKSVLDKGLEFCSYHFLYPNKETVRRGRVKLGSPQGNALPSELSRLDSFEVLFLLTAALEKNL